MSEAENRLFGDETTYAYVGSATLSMTDGLISLLDYSEGDLELTAKICAVSPGMLGAEQKSSILTALYSAVDGRAEVTETEFAAALLGLAALGEPVLDRLYYFASVCGEYPLEAKLYLTAALAYIGDFSAASELYATLKTEYARSGEGEELYFNGSGTEESIRLTALALMSASRINRTDASGMVSYLSERGSASGYYGLELAGYIRYFMPTEKASASFSYRFGEGGETVNVSLSAGEVYSIQLTKSGFDSLAILDYEGGISVRAAYSGSPEDALEGAEPTSELSVTKAITPYDEKLGLYRVDISFSGSSDRAYISFDISDVIPSGARFVSNVNRSGNSYISGDRYIWASIYNTGGQQMKGSIWISSRSSSLKWNEATSEYSFSGSVSYIIRGAVTGEFIAERTLVCNTRTGAFALGNRLELTISESGWKVKEIK